MLLLPKLSEELLESCAYLSQLCTSDGTNRLNEEPPYWKTVQTAYRSMIQLFTRDSFISQTAANNKWRFFHIIGRKHGASLKENFLTLVHFFIFRYYISDIFNLIQFFNRTYFS